MGKTAVSKELGKALKCRVLNEKEFALKEAIGEWDAEENELVVNVKKLEKALKKMLQKEKSIIIEGHLLCETKLPVDCTVLIRVDPELLELRLEQKGYAVEKVQDNVFCEGIEYCKKHLERRYSKKKIIEVMSRKTVKETCGKIIKLIKSRNG